MFKAIALYPNNEDNYLNKCEDYIVSARKYGFNEVFTSLHMPEYSTHDQISFLYDLSIIAKKYEMIVVADIGGKSIKEIIKNDDLLNRLENVDFFRLDYGYDHNDIKYLHSYLNNRGFIINASIYDEIQSKEEVNFIRSLNCEVRACHNFYPRVDSGIDEEFALRQNIIFSSLDVPVYYCVPNVNNPRGPIYEGLPSVEAHRYMDIKSISEELLNKYNADGILFSDNFYSEEYFDAFNTDRLNNIIEIKVNTINDKYDDIVYQIHEFRYDSNSSFLRSKSSRTMAEFAKKIKPENCIERLKGSITIDNINNQRYSGELQVVLVDSDSSDKVNVVGHIDEHDIRLLTYYRNGYKYKFVK